jgi:hypothetical protein
MSGSLDIITFQIAISCWLLAASFELIHTNFQLVARSLRLVANAFSSKRNPNQLFTKWI